MTAALRVLGESKVAISDTSSFVLHMHQTDKPTYQKLRTGPGMLSERERLEKDLRQATALVAKLEAEIGDTRGSAAIGAHFAGLRTAASEAITEMPQEQQLSIMSGIVRSDLSSG